MNSFQLLRLAFATLVISSPIACGDDEKGESTSQSCSPSEQTGCVGTMVCEEVEGGQPACFSPLLVSGRVFDLVTDGGIEAARIVARDENGAALSSVAISDPDGGYELRVPARRSADGIPVSRSFTLRADAMDYQAFPTAPRVALPLDVGDAEGESPTLSNTATDIGLVALPDTAGLGSVSGRVVADDPGGTLVVVDGATGIADLDGDYVVFNVPSGDVAVRGYLAGYNFDPQDTSVKSGADTAGVDLISSGVATSRVSGQVQIVNAPGGSQTSVVLAVDETFNETVARGEVPPGLRVANVDGSFLISNVPDGTYVVLAGFENDELVRDPDTSIGGTELVRINVSGDDVEIADSFKVTEALAVVSPGASKLDIVSGDLNFAWEDDSSEDEYRVELFDSFGTLVWEVAGDFDPGGSADANVDYDGPPLIAGMIYQFRATSIKSGVPISATEDLLGVFQYE